MEIDTKGGGGGDAEKAIGTDATVSKTPAVVKEFTAKPEEAPAAEPSSPAKPTLSSSSGGSNHNDNENSNDGSRSPGEISENPKSTPIPPGSTNRNESGSEPPAGKDTTNPAKKTASLSVAAAGSGAKVGLKASAAAAAAIAAATSPKEKNTNDNKATENSGGGGPTISVSGSKPTDNNRKTEKSTSTTESARAAPVVAPPPPSKTVAKSKLLTSAGAGVGGGPASSKTTTTTKPAAPKPKPVKVKSSSSSVSSGKSSSTKSTAGTGSIPSLTANNNIGSATKSLKKGARKKRKSMGVEEAEEKVEKGPSAAASAAAASSVPKKKKPKRKKEKEEVEKPTVKTEKAKKVRKQTKKALSSGSANSGAGPSYAEHLQTLPGLSPEEIRDQELMRKALEEEQYSANGSVVETDSDDDEQQYMYKGQSIRLDRSHLLSAARKSGWLGDLGSTGMMLATSSSSSSSPRSGKDGDMNDDDGYEEEAILHEDGTSNNGSGGSKKKSSKNKKKGRNQYTNRNSISSSNTSCFRIDDRVESGGKSKTNGSLSSEKGMDTERDEGSIFGQTTGSSNSTWVECDKCKKWRRLRGVVDHSKLPKKWYCSMNRNDPERARCSAPEEEYDAPITPESAADARTRKHLRVWVRRLQCNEQYESRLPTLTRNKKRSVASTSKEPHEWIRCCNPSCGKWRAILKIMDAKQNVIERTSNGEWYCVMNTWDEKTASCAAPQENLPAVGCPPWVLQDIAN